MQRWFVMGIFSALFFFACGFDWFAPIFFICGCLWIVAAVVMYRIEEN